MKPMEDGCPLPPEDRVLGMQTNSMELALSLASKTGNLAFAPRALAARHLETGALVEIPVEGWQCEVELHVSYHEDRLRTQEREALLEVARRAVSACGTQPSGCVPGSGEAAHQTERAAGFF